MPLSVEAPFTYVRPSSSASARSPDPKCLSSLLLEALLDSVLLLEGLEQLLSPILRGKRKGQAAGVPSHWNTCVFLRFADTCSLQTEGLHSPE